MLARATDRFTCLECSFVAILQVAYCYQIGFGVGRDVAKAGERFQEIKRMLKQRPSLYDSFQVDVLESDPSTGSTEVLRTNTGILDRLLQQGFLDFNLADILTEGLPADLVIDKIEAECSARVAQFGEKHHTALYFKLLLSILYSQHGRGKEAEALQRFLYETCQDPDPAQHEMNLRQVTELLIQTLEQGGDLLQARALQEDLLRRTTKACGVNHPETLHAMEILAGMMADCGEFASAERLQMIATESLRGHYGEFHPQTIKATSSLAMIYRDQGKFEVAEEMALLALKNSERVSGTSSLQTLAVHEKLALVLYDMYALAKAEDHLIFAFEGLKTRAGMSDERTLKAGVNLTSLRIEQGRLKDAEDLVIPLLAESKRSMGPRSHITLAATSNLASLKYRDKEFGDAETLFLGLIGALKEQKDVNSKALVSPMSNLGQLYTDIGNLEAGIMWQRQAIEAAKSVFAAPHPTLAQIQANLAVALEAHHGHSEAKQLLENAVVQFEELFGQQDKRTKNIAKVLDRVTAYLNADEQENLG